MLEGLVAALVVVVGWHGWTVRRAGRQLSAQLATVALAVREVHDRLEELEDK